MKLPTLLAVGGALAAATALSSSATTALREYAISLDGSIVDTFIPPGGRTPITGVNYGTFDASTGLGTFTISVAGAGNHDIRVFFDHDVGSILDDEIGSAVGAPAGGQTWEIDEPFYGNNGYLGNIYSNFATSVLDGTVNFGGTGTPNSQDDMAMAMGWTFTGPADLAITLGLTAPGAGFYLRQEDESGIGDVIYLSGIVTPTSGPGPGPVVIPEASTVGVGGLLTGLVAAAGWHRRRSRRA